MRFQMFAVAAVLVSLLQTASAQEVELRIDAFESGDFAMAHGGFITGEMGAVCLIPDGSGPFTVTKLHFLFGSLSPSDPQTITLHIYDNPGCSVVPGSEIYTNGYELTPSSSAFQEIDLSLDNVQVSGAFRVAIEVNHDGPPSIMNDLDGISPTHPEQNFLYAIDGTGAWAASPAGGDWIIRAFVISGSMPDAGPTHDANPGAPDAGPAGPDAGSGQECTVHSECPTGQYCDDTDHCTYDCRIAAECPNTGMECTSLGQCVEGEGDGGGCGCQTPSRPAAPLGTLLLAAIGLLWWRRRR